MTRPQKKGPARLPSPKQLERLLPHDERLPRRVSVPSRKKHIIVAGVIVALLLFAALLLSTLHLLPWQLTGKDAAVVNGERVPMAEVEAGYDALHPQVKAQFTKEQFLNETIIPQVLILQEAEKRDITTSDEEVKTTVDEVLVTQKLTMEQLDAKLVEVGLGRDAFQEMVRKRLVINKLLNETLPPPEVSEEEIRSFFEINKNYLTTTYGNVTLADTYEGIRQYLATQKQQMALQEYVAGLWAKATIVVNAAAFK